MFGALKRGFRSMASLLLVRNVVGELRPKRTLAASRGFLAAARLSCFRRLRLNESVTTNRPEFHSAAYTGLTGKVTNQHVLPTSKSFNC